MTAARDVDVVRYVIVVHGIGQQRKNESVQLVIQRFAQARSQPGRQIGDPITLGLLASHVREAPIGEFTKALEEGWIEFEGIPVRPPDKSVQGQTPFVGRQAQERGKNLRFVDLHWSSVMDDQFEAFGEPMADWTRSLIDRLEIRDAPVWIRHMLRGMRRGLIPLQKILRRKYPEQTDRVIDRFLGDVQLYGEYQATRGMAVRRFHERLARLEADHYAAELKTGGVPRDPRYVVIGHSLGSVLSFDALLFAHMDRSAKPKDLLGLLPEYDRNPSTKKQDGRFPALEWIRNVDAFVTLGSPIDKFLALFWLNYEHLLPQGEPDPKFDWVDPDLLKLRGNAEDKIAHYNYCDEQDPVGHSLDAAYSSGALVERIFDRKEDVVYTRYPVPGVAHVGYWTDADLFRRILDQAVDGRSGDAVTPVVWFKWRTYILSLFFTYVALPLLGWIAATAIMVWALRVAEHWGTRLFWILVSLVVLRYTCWAMRLMVEWREIVVTKARNAASVLSTRQGGFRSVALWMLWVCVLVLPVVWLYFLVASVAEIRITEFPANTDAVVKDAITWLRDFAAALKWSIEPGWKWPETAWNGIVSATNAMLRWTHVADLFAWPPLAKLGTDLKNAVWNPWPLPAVVASAYGFLIGLWNLLVSSRAWWRFRGGVTLDFVHYMNNDPTRPRRGANA